MKTLRPKLTFANVVSCLALFVALGGSAYAATQLKKNSVGTKQLKKNAVAAAKIKNGAVSTAKLADGAINGSKVQNATLTGTQINSSTLGKVPSAVNADTAGNGAKQINFASGGGDPAVTPLAPGAHQLLALGSLTVRASCVNEGGSERLAYLTLGSSTEATLEWETVKYNNPGTQAFSDGTTIGPNKNYPVSNVKGGNRTETGLWLYQNEGETISISASVSAGTSFEECRIIGTAVRATS